MDDLLVRLSMTRKTSHEMYAFVKESTRRRLVKNLLRVKDEFKIPDVFFQSFTLQRRACGAGIRECMFVFVGVFVGRACASRRPRACMSSRDVVAVVVVEC